MGLDTNMWRMRSLGEIDKNNKNGIEVLPANYDIENIIDNNTEQGINNSFYMRKPWNVVNMISEFENNSFDDIRQQYLDGGIEYAFDYTSLQFIDVKSMQEYLKDLTEDIKQMTEAKYVKNGHISDIEGFAKDIDICFKKYELSDYENYQDWQTIDQIRFLQFIMDTDVTKYPFIIVDNWY